MKSQLDELDAISSRTGTEIIYNFIGRALTAWSNMEEYIIIIASLLLGAQSKKVGLVMYSIINFSVWLSIVDELFTMEPKFAHLRPKWNKLADRIRKLKDHRDRLAHHPVSAGAKWAEAFGGAILRPPTLDHRQKSLKFQPLNSEEVLDFIDSVTSITNGLGEVADAMMDIAESSGGKPDEPTPGQDQPTGSQ
jgi:hypothetical protein